MTTDAEPTDNMPSVTQIFSDLVVIFRNKQQAAKDGDHVLEQVLQNERINLEEFC